LGARSISELGYFVFYPQLLFLQISDQRIVWHRTAELFFYLRLELGMLCLECVYALIIGQRHLPYVRVSSTLGRRSV